LGESSAPATFRGNSPDSRNLSVEEYYYSREGQRLGPVSGDQLKQLASSGQLQPNDLIWKEGMANWIQAARVKGLFPVAAPQPPEIPLAAPAGSPADVHAAGHVEAGGPRQGETSDAAKLLARQAKEAAMAASSDALKAFKTLIKNPVGGLREAFETLGPKAALGGGIVFGVVAILCFVVSDVISAHGFPPFGTFLKSLLVDVLLVAIPVGVYFGGQAAFRGEGGIEADVFLAGASVLPLGVMAVLLTILASKSLFVMAALFIIATSTTALMSYSGSTSLLRLPEVVATFVVPLIFICYVVAIWLLSGAGSVPTAPQFPF
jgi:uncharacterized protein DUF4339